MKCYNLSLDIKLTYNIYMGAGVEAIKEAITKENEPFNKGFLIIFTGATASGKSSLIREIAGILHAKRDVTYTDRDKRPGEQDKIDYNFVTKAQLEALRAGGMEFVFENIRDREGGKDWYGACKADIEPLGDMDTILALDISAAGNINQLLEMGFGHEKAEQLGKRLIVIYVGAEEQVLRERFIARSKKDATLAQAEFARRYQRDVQDLAMFGEVWQRGDPRFLRVQNNDLRQTAMDCIQVIERQKMAVNGQN